MKTIKTLLLISVILSIACIGCSKYEDNTGVEKSLKSTGPPMPSQHRHVWTENFAMPFTLTNNWALYGKPQPKWVQSAYGQQGLFDNNGPSPVKNYAVSNALIGKGLGYTVEAKVIAKILDAQGGCVCPGIAVSKETNPVIKNGEIETGISMRVVYIGPNAVWYPAKLRGHTWLTMEFLAGNEAIENDEIISSGYIPADCYANSWHKLKFVVTSSGYVKFYCDYALVWAPFNRIHSIMKSDKNVVLGYTSDGNPKTLAGIAYHDYVKATYAYISSEDE